ncbi:Os02g0831550 [Oryza sativa Japonica Group]|uniref:Os02g0831550 protein n=1 Tax=Oryza sativa subsp. japonica TaxID=39947 RepID=A0A0P0VRP7_ORYSJ|nr:hypothetical protein EE612_014666 [Oryza sativa]BAS81759.1 Os02g0831550 [Oryza sativa Japonica Group]
MSNRETHCGRTLPSSVLNGTRRMLECFVFSIGSNSTLHLVPFASGMSLVSCNIILGVAFRPCCLILCSSSSSRALTWSRM